MRGLDTLLSYLAVTCLTSSATATPLQTHRLLARVDWGNQEEWCSRANHIESYQVAENVFKDLELENFIASVVNQYENDGYNWTAEEHALLKTDISYNVVDDCQVLELNSCRPGMSDWDCDAYWNESQKKGKNIYAWKRSYWTFALARGMHDKLTIMNAALQAATTTQSLNISTMIKDFSPEEDTSLDMSVVKTWFMSATGVGNTLLGLSNPVGSAALSIFASIVGELPIWEGSEKEEVKLGDIQTALASYYDKARKSFQNTLRYANGGEGDPKEMPKIHGGGHLDDHSTRASLLASPLWLVSNNAPEISDLMESTQTNMRLKLLDTVIQASGWALMPSDEGNKKDCDSKLGYHWLDPQNGEGERCFTLFKSVGADWVSREKANDDLFQKLEAYGLKGTIGTYYAYALRCAKAGGPKSQDVGAALATGEWPECFFTLPVKKVKETTAEGCIVTGDSCITGQPSKTAIDFFS